MTKHADVAVGVDAVARLDERVVHRPRHRVAAPAGRLKVRYAIGPSTSNSASRSGHDDASLETDMSTGRTALEGIRVLDVTQVMAGPVLRDATMRHGRRRDQGGAAGGGSDAADGRARTAPTAPASTALNRGKRGIVLDLKRPRGRQRVPAARGARRHPHRELPARGDARASASTTRRCSPSNPR